MTFDSSARVEQMEGVRDQIVTTLTKGGLDKLGDKELALLEKTITNGTKVAFTRQEAEMRQKSAAGEEDIRRGVAAFILSQRESGNRRAQQVREGAIPGGAAGLVDVTARELLPNEGLQGQFQVGFEVLSGQKDFKPEENLPPPAREELPAVP